MDTGKDDCVINNRSRNNRNCGNITYCKIFHFTMVIRNGMKYHVENGGLKELSE